MNNDCSITKEQSISTKKVSHITGADPGFQVRGGGHIKKLRRAGEA
jgi:hypothetical protein